ncbi:hypothetical protein [Corallococcus caeni]|uniref:Glycosyltransferase RgtA/B/C/D-like domain-containing protein n=1 Tax=Corallococcus caeni TaxID=3082388 RepID=A0ABQ6R097_9BACT|nr:hypothetical protein ASNO1_59740 [Corallococcus sp. NO1]
MSAETTDATPVSPGLGPSWGGVLLLCAGLILLGAWGWLAPEYLMARGFPLDDAWIHAVYARSLAAGQGLAYNPGIPATGETSPLWAWVLVPSHWLSQDVATRVLLTKLTGFLLHVMASGAAFLALGGRRGDRWALGGALLMLLHPDLVAASVSGMEVPLASLCIWGLVLALKARSVLALGLLAAAAPLCRPELPVVTWTLPVLFLLGREPLRELARVLGAIAVGTAVSFGGMGLWYLAASGRPLPATFYAKVGGGGPGLWASLMRGFTELLPGLSFTALPVLGVLVLLVAERRGRPGPSEGWRLAAALVGAGLAFCCVSFALIHPLDPAAFYHQRYLLPALSLLVVPFVPLAGGRLQARVPRPGHRLWVVLALLPAGVCALRLPARLERLTNDARNIDDVQVSVGRMLSGAPPEAVVWATDAGAVRYFGQAFVVDMLGLNTPQMLGADAQAYLDAHAPAYLETVPTWSRLVDPDRSWPTPRIFRPSTEYTVTRIIQMRLHALVFCAQGTGTYDIRGRTFAFRCAPLGPPFPGPP